MVVSNTSPISALSEIGRLDLLRQMFTEVHIPSAVHRELLAWSKTEFVFTIRTAIDARWLIPTEIADPQKAAELAAKYQIDCGEAEAIRLAIETHASLLLMDETDGRAAAIRHGAVCTGVLGILRRAKIQGLIPSLAPELALLRTANFYISRSLEQKLLIDAGELN